MIRSQWLHSRSKTEKRVMQINLQLMYKTHNSLWNLNNLTLRIKIIKSIKEIKQINWLLFNRKWRRSEVEWRVTLTSRKTPRNGWLNRIRKWLECSLMHRTTVRSFPEASRKPSITISSSILNKSPHDLKSCRVLVKNRSSSARISLTKISTVCLWTHTSLLICKIRVI
jgi:hypothetical protein